ERDWSEPFKSKVNYHPLKNISIQFGEQKVRGEAMLTPFGIEGGAVYAISNQIRNTIMKKGKASIFLDLKPDLSLEEVIVKLKQQKSKDSLKNQLRKGLGLDSGSIMTIRELSAPEKLRDVEYLASQIKRLELELSAVRPLSEAISTSGGVSFSALDSHLQILDLPGYYIAGEMLDFEAPTGGYLLQGCFSSAWRIVQGIDAGS
ncbi:MAG: aminoacetone oxidase family FAD-binding enzyme, partial [Halobacteriovoraceae bacterium]|nr:aminoacetone oxidase family FAD-binding enzyme [Halobacteriovoraceae bacterium]